MSRSDITRCLNRIQLRLEPVGDEFNSGLVTERAGVDLHFDHGAREGAGLDGDEVASVGFYGPPAAFEFGVLLVAFAGGVDDEIEAIEGAIDGAVHLLGGALVDIDELAGLPEAVPGFARGGARGDERDGGRAAREDEEGGEEIGRAHV